MSRQLTFVAALAITSLAVPAAAALAVRTPANGGAKAMVLTLSDLSPGYGQNDGHYVSNAELKSKDPAWKDYAKLGRITGYNASYTTIGVAGLTEIDSFASIYKTGVGAHNSLLLTFVQAGQEGTKLLMTKAPLLGGDELVYRIKVNGSKVDRYAVAWRHGSVFAEVIAVGIPGTVGPADVVALAKRQDLRITHALKRS